MGDAIIMRKGLKETYDWYESRGKQFIDKYTNVGEYVKKYNEVNDTNEVSGVYLISFNACPIVVGESCQMGVRFMEHMKALEEYGEERWGVNIDEIKTGKVAIKIEILKTGLLNEQDRRETEIIGIKEHQPILQVKYEKYYPNDKAQKQNGRWLLRHEIREDQNIKRKYRRERIKEFLDL